MKCRDDSIEQRFDDGRQIDHRCRELQSDVHLESLGYLGCTQHRGTASLPPNSVWLRVGRERRNFKGKNAFRMNCRNWWCVNKTVFVVVIEVCSVAADWWLCMQPFKAKTIPYNRAECRSSNIVEQDIFDITESLRSGLISCIEDSTRAWFQRRERLSNFITSIQHRSCGFKGQSLVRPKSYIVDRRFQLIERVCVHQGSAG